MNCARNYVPIKNKLPHDRKWDVFKNLITFIIAHPE